MWNVVPGFGYHSSDRSILRDIVGLRNGLPVSAVNCEKTGGSCGAGAGGLAGLVTVVTPIEPDPRSASKVGRSIVRLKEARALTSSCGCSCRFTDGSTRVNFAVPPRG